MGNCQQVTNKAEDESNTITHGSTPKGNIPPSSAKRFCKQFEKNILKNIFINNSHYFIFKRKIIIKKFVKNTFKIYKNLNKNKLNFKLDKYANP